MHYTIGELVNIGNASSILPLPGAVITHAGYDSRRISRPQSMLFFALDGKTRSGADFVLEAWQKGVRNFVVNNHFQTEAFSDSNFIIVPNVLLFLQQLATYHRKKFTGPVIGITGSNGKTVVKEWLYNLLQNDFSVARSPRSYNSTLGAAISILGIEKWHNMAILEAGISKAGDMDELETMISPSLGIFTHLGTAHDENFSSKAEKAAEKMKLFSQCDVLVYPNDVAEIKEEANKLKVKNPLLKTITWGFSEGAHFRITELNVAGNSIVISFVHRSTTHKLQIPVISKAGIENAMTCLCTLAALERWDEAHVAAFTHLTPLENRLAFFEGKQGNYIVNDSYSNDLDSLEVALDFMLRQQPNKPHTVILSDLQQADPDKLRLYTRVAEMLQEKKTTHLIGIGPELFAKKDVFAGLESEFFENTDQVIHAGVCDRIQGRAILVKGARQFQLERITDKLRKQQHKTVLEIDLTALRNNFSFFKHHLKPGVKMMAMVKAFGYGSGSFEAAKTLQFAGADYFAVAFVDEGIELRKAGILLPIMVMNTGISDLSSLLQYQLEPVVFDKKGLEDFGSQGSAIKVHIEIDTGMHRLGFNSKNLVADFTGFSAHLTIASVFSHLAASEAPEHDDFTRTQLHDFQHACAEISEITGQTFIKHIANTGGILRFEEAHLDMVRLGIGLYGIDPSGQPGSYLDTVISLKSSISQIKTIPPGDSVGYGRRGISDKARQIAILPLGYADGLWRMLGNGKGYAMIAGKKAAYVGSICMDMAMVDVTDLDCKQGDEVEIFGRQLKAEILAQLCETIPYEILTSVSGRVRREYTGEN